ncbi:MAG: hypothetical protein H6641_10195 [Caldilineaceae bacterium]|nr:hypothetical protein [Caldilineaceae bacterium]
MNQKPEMSDSTIDKQIPAAGEPSHAEHPNTHFEREDDRWYVRFRISDWLILLTMIGIYLLWTGVVYWFEPGIR